jgi:CRP-like cAMP-binding protein
LIFHEGDSAPFFYIVQNGRVKLFKSSHSGKSFIIHVASSSNSLDSYVLLESRNHDVSAEAMDDVTVLRIKREQYLFFVHEYPSIAIKSADMLAKVLNSAYERIIDLIGERAEQRLYNVLIMLYSKFGTTLHFTCDEIADLSGTTRETAVRVLSRLRQSGIILSCRGQIVLRDPARLRELSRSSYVL